MAARMDYQSCRYSSWCPDRYDADEWYEVMDSQYAIDATSATSATAAAGQLPAYSGRAATSNEGLYTVFPTSATSRARMMPLSEDMSMTVSEDEPLDAATAAMMPLMPATAQTAGAAGAGRRPAMMMMMPAAGTDAEAATLSNPFDWRELEASCRKLDEANIRITELDITDLCNSPTTDSADHANSFAGGSAGSAPGERVGVLQTSQPHHVAHIYGFRPLQKLPPSAVHHMPSSTHAAGTRRSGTHHPTERHLHAHTVSSANTSATHGAAVANAHSSTGGHHNGLDGSGTFSRPRSASTIAALSSIVGGSGGVLGGAGGSGSPAPYLPSGLGSRGSGSGPVSGPASGLGPRPFSSGAALTQDVLPLGADLERRQVLLESGCSDKAASSDSGDSVALSCGSGTSSNSSSNAAEGTNTLDAAKEARAGGIKKITEPAKGGGNASADSTAGASSSNNSHPAGSIKATSTSASGSGGKSVMRVMRAFADRCQRAFLVTPGRGRALKMTAAVRHRRCNSNERLDQLHLAVV